MPLKTAVRAALSAPPDTMILYPSDLLFHDSGIRAMSSDNAAAHVRYTHKLLRAPADSLPRQVATWLPNTQRGYVVQTTG